MPKSVAKRGDLLVAAVSLLDPNFQRSVVLICEHQERGGSYGLILNRPVEPSAELTQEYPFMANALFSGGPVQPEALQVLHRFGEDIPGARVILPDVWIGGDFEVLKSGLVSGRLDGRQCRFFVGYSGWAPGQLATEFQTRSWLMAPGVADLVFHGEPDKLWLLAVRARAQVEPMFAHYPGNLRWN